MNPISPAVMLLIMIISLRLQITMYGHTYFIVVIDKLHILSAKQCRDNDRRVQGIFLVWLS